MPSGYSRFDSVGGNPIKCWGCNSSVHGEHREDCDTKAAQLQRKVTNVGPPAWWAESSAGHCGLGTLSHSQLQTTVKQITDPNDPWLKQGTKPSMGKHLPTDAQERKKIPLYSGLMKYFPDALVEVARLSYIGNEQHNPGQKLHWAREKSTDQEDTAMRHFLESGTLDVDGVRHTAKAAWRILATLQLEIEAAREGK